MPYGSPHVSPDSSRMRFFTGEDVAFRVTKGKQHMAGLIRGGVDLAEKGAQLVGKHFPLLPGSKRAREASLITSAQTAYPGRPLPHRLRRALRRRAAVPSPSSA
jgi:hypothetical protein